MSEQPLPSDVSSDDRLWALLAYIFTPLVPVILMLMEDKKNRPFIRMHNAQALVIGIVNLVLFIVLGWLIVPACLGFALFIACIYWGIQAYNGKSVVIPVVTDFVKNQGWA